MKKFLRNISIFFHSLFFGMKGGDKEVLYSKTQGLEPDYHSEQEVETGTVYQDLLREQETQKVKEVRDATYRVFRESDKYLVEGDFGDNVEIFKPRVIKKTDSFFKKQHCNIAQIEGDSVFLIQEQKEYDNDTVTKYDESELGYSIDPDRLIKCNYDGFTPTFDISKYLKRIVIFNSDKEFQRIELYFSEYSGQFTKTDAIFLKKLKDCLEGNLRHFDSLDIDSIEFITNKAFGADDLLMFKYNNLKLKEMFSFDGNIIVSYLGTPECNGIDLTAKYRTAELDEKYEKKAQRSNVIDIESVINKY